MSAQTTKELASKRCVPCEGGVAPYDRAAAEAQTNALEGWQLSANGKQIRREWRVTDFLAGLSFFQAVGQVAEADGHHPDLHLEGYRNVSIEIWTHAIGGLSENDFILAAKINQLQVDTA